jgi:hypothetical protein
VRDAARLYGGDAQVRPDLRRTALAALQRANVALDGWGEKGQEEWYLHRALEFDDSGVDEISFSGAQDAARGRALNFGGVYVMWNTVDAYCSKHDIASSKSAAATQGVRHDFIAFTLGALNRIQFPAPSFRLLKTPASFEPHSK